MEINDSIDEIATLKELIKLLEDGSGKKADKIFQMEKKIQNLEEQILRQKKIVLHAYEDGNDILKNKNKDKVLRISLLGAIIFRTYHNFFNDQK